MGEQLELELFGPGLPFREPWGGRSPRELTRAYILFSLRALPPGGVMEDAIAGGKVIVENCPSEQLGFPFLEEV